MNMKLFTDRARRVMQLANQKALQFNHEIVEPEHILLGLGMEGTGIAACVLKNLEPNLCKAIESILTEKTKETEAGRLPQGIEAKKVLEYAKEEADSMGSPYAGTEHLLLGLLRLTDGRIAKTMKNLGIQPEDIRQKVLDLLGKRKVEDGETPTELGEMLAFRATINALLVSKFGKIPGKIKSEIDKKNHHALMALVTIASSSRTLDTFVKKLDKIADG